MPQLFVHDALVERLAHLPARPYEVGGWLLGYWAEGEDSVFVTHATPPASRGTPFGVHISGRGHRHKFDTAWDASAGAVTFLGDWHTHPGCPPMPSDQDNKAMTKLATQPDFGTPQPLMAILETARWPWAARVCRLAFYIRALDGGLAALNPVVTNELPPEVTTVPEWSWPSRRDANRARTSGDRR